MGADGEQIGVVDTRTRSVRPVIWISISWRSRRKPTRPCARIMDYGKFKYERDIRQKEARKKQSRTEVKEIKFRPKIDPHDYATKKGHVERFLRRARRSRSPSCSAGARWRTPSSVARSWTGWSRTSARSAVVEAMPKQEGRNMIMVIAPNKKHRSRSTSRGGRVQRSDADRTDEAEPVAPAAAEPQRTGAARGGRSPAERHRIGRRK